MSKRAYISRYLLIIKKLKQKSYSTAKELLDYIETQSEYLQMQDDELDIRFSKRTLARDLREIRTTFGIDIEYSKSEKGYYISQNEGKNMNFQRMIEAFDMFNSLNIARDLTPHVYLEKRKPQRTENLYGLLHAIKNTVQIRFVYHKFWEDEATLRTVEPYALKEFRNRWYLMAKDLKDNKIKSFALDRLSMLDITKQQFEYPKDYNVEEIYRYCFGIINPDDQEVEEIILSLNPLQGKYIQTLPLHETQEILINNENELRIKLQLYITHDFVMEILSLGDNVKVLQPQSLADEIKSVHERTFQQY